VILMNTIIESIKKEFSNNILGVSISHNETYLTIKKEKIVKMCDHLYHHLDIPLVCIFATDERKEEGSFKIHYVFSVDREDAFIILRIDIDGKNPKFPSITNKVAAANWYEREIQDLFGLIPVGHPDPRSLMNFEDWPAGVHPLRKDFDIKTKPPRIKGEYAYRRVEGEGVYEIPVGPVHAGVIEPGHFRFSVAGEPIINLEIRHFYTHKGVEKLFENISLDKAVFLAERISGDNSVAHAVAFCQAMENSPAMALCTDKLNAVGEISSPASSISIMAKDLPNSPWAELNTVGIIVCSSIHWLAAQNTILANGLKRRFNIFGTLANNSPCLAKSCSASACNGGQTAHFCKIKSCCINIGPH